MGISTKRYLPAIGTAGFERVAVSGDKRLPWPPPSTMHITFDVILLELNFHIILCIPSPSGPTKNRAPSCVFATVAGVLHSYKAQAHGLQKCKYHQPIHY